MGIAADARHAFQPKVERCQSVFSVLVTLGQAGRFEEWDDEASQTAIDMKTNLMLQSELGEHRDVILRAVRVVDT